MPTPDWQLFCGPPGSTLRCTQQATCPNFTWFWEFIILCVRLGLHYLVCCLGWAIATNLETKKWRSYMMLAHELSWRRTSVYMRMWKSFKRTFCFWQLVLKPHFRNVTCCSCLPQDDYLKSCTSFDIQKATFLECKMASQCTSISVVILCVCLCMDIAEVITKAVWRT